MRKPIIRKRGESWQLDYGNVAGRRLQRSFRTKAEAEGAKQLWLNECDNKKIQVADLSDMQRIDVITALDKLGDRGTLTTAVDYFLSHANPAGGKKPVLELVDEYIQSKVKAGRRPATIQDAQGKVSRFARDVSKQYIHDLTTGDVESWLDAQGFSPPTWDSYRRAIVGLFNYALKRKYVAENPASVLEAVEFDESIPGIMDVADVRKLLATAQEHAPQLVPYLAIGFFAGLRPETELTQLDWKFIDLAGCLITVIPETAKKRRQRHVKISDNLMRWLSPCKQKEGSIYYSRRVLLKVRKLADVKWSNDVMRHSFASYHLACHNDAALTSLQLGHTKQDILHRNYKNILTPTGKRVTEQYALEYWGILPEKQDNVIKMMA